MRKGGAYADWISTMAVPLGNPSGTGEAVARANSNTADTFTDVYIVLMRLSFVVDLAIVY